MNHEKHEAYDRFLAMPYEERTAHVRQCAGDIIAAIGEIPDIDHLLQEISIETEETLRPHKGGVAFQISITAKFRDAILWKTYRSHLQIRLRAYGFASIALLPNDPKLRNVYCYTKNVMDMVYDKLEFIRKWSKGEANP